MEVEHDDIRLSPNLGENLIRLLKGAVERGHKGAPREIHYGDVYRLEGKDAVPLPRRSLRIVRGTHEIGLIVHKGKHILLVPDVIARGHNIGAARVELIERLAREPLAACRILSVDDNDIDPLLRSEPWSKRTKRAPSRTTNYVTDQHNAHGTSSHLLYRL